MTDSELVSDALMGDSHCHELLLDRHLKALIGFFNYLSVPKLIIDDLAQETFIKAFRNLGQYDKNRSFINWLFTIARNTYYDERRKAVREKNFLDACKKPSGESLEDRIVERQTAKELLETLSNDEKFLLELRIYKELPFSEISEIMGETENSLRVRFHRLIIRLRVACAKETES